MEAHTVSGQHYSRNSMKAIRAGLERYLTEAPHRKAFSIIHNKVFAPSNDALDSHLRSLAIEDGGVAIYKTQTSFSYRARRCGAVVYGNTPESLV